MTAAVDGTRCELAPGASLTVPPQALHMFVRVSPAVTFLLFDCCAYMVLGGSMMALAGALGRYPRTGDSIPGTLAATVPAVIALVAAAV